MDPTNNQQEIERLLNQNSIRESEVRDLVNKNLELTRDDDTGRGYTVGDPDVKRLHKAFENYRTVHYTGKIAPREIDLPTSEVKKYLFTPEQQAEFTTQHSRSTQGKIEKPKDTTTYTAPWGTKMQAGERALGPEGQEFIGGEGLTGKMYTSPAPERATVGIKEIMTVTPDILDDYPGFKVGDRIATTDTGEQVKVDKNTRSGDKLNKAEVKESDASGELEANRKATAEFKQFHVKLGDGQYISKEDWNKAQEQWAKAGVAPEYTNIGLTKGLDELNAAIGAHNKGTDTTVPAPDMAWVENIKANAKETGRQMAKALLYTIEQPANISVPGYYEVRNWDNMSTGEKILDLSIGAASLLAVLGIIKVAGVGAKALGTVGKAERAAVQAGKAGKALDDATNIYNRFLTSKTVDTFGLLNPQRASKLANAVQKAQVASVKADQKLLNIVGKLDYVSPKELATIEKKAKIPGLAKSINNISNSQRDVSNAWKAVERTSKSFDPNNPNFKANINHIKALENLENKRAKLQVTLAKASDTLVPRYKASPPAPEYQGQAIKLPKRNIVLDLSPEIFGREYETRPSRTRVAVAERARTKIDVKGKAVFREQPTPKAVGKVSTPKVAPRGKPTIFVVRTGRAAPAQAAERVGAMTPEQAARQLGETIILDDVVGSRLPTTLKGLKRAINPRTGARQTERMGSQAASKAATSTTTAPALKQSAKTTPTTGLTSRPNLGRADAPVTRTPPLTPTRLAPPAKPPTTPPRTPPRLPLPRRWTGREVREYIKNNPGGVAYKMGELKSGEVWDVAESPYASEADYFTLVGKRPDGATIIKRGKGSAYGTAQTVKGPAPKREIKIDRGIVDISLKPGGGRKVKMRVTPDPKQETTGDITIGKGNPRISSRTPRISRHGMRISGRMPRLK